MKNEPRQDNIHATQRLHGVRTGDMRPHDAILKRDRPQPKKVDKKEQQK